MDDSTDEFDGFLTEEQIENISDAREGFEILCERELFLNYVSNLDDIKEILKLKYHSIINSDQNSKRNQLYETYPDLMKKMKKLLNKLKSCIELPEFQREIGGIYKHSESRTESQIEELKKMIERNEFPILTAGEAKAGKSTFINLLIGKEILPMDLVTCTRIICEIRNSNDGTVTFISPNKPDIVKRLSIPLDKSISDIVKKETEADCIRAVYKYPVDFLANYTYLVDSPGIGDNFILESMTFDYLTNCAPAFIFVLNATNSNGLNLKAKQLIETAKQDLTKQTERYITDLTNINQVQEYYFQYHKAIFILNHWDIVRGNAKSKEEVEEVRKIIIQEIKSLWHESAEENGQIFFISAKQANEWQKHGYVQREIINIRNCIKNLIVNLYQKNVENSFQLFDLILNNLEEKILQKFNATLDNRYCRLYDQRHAEHLCDMLGNLIKEMDNRKSNIREQLKPKFETMAIFLTEHLKSADVENTILDQSKTSITATDNMELLTVAFKKILETRLYDEIIRWETKHKQMEQLYNFLFGLFEDNIRQISDEIKISNTLINKESLIKAWKSTRESAITSFDNEYITKIEKVFIISTITLLFPVVALAGLLATPLIMRHILKEKKTNEEKLALYKENPEVYLRNMITQSLQKLTVNDVRKGFFNNIQRKCEDHIKAFDNFITTKINEKRQLVMEIDNENREIPEILNSLSKLYYKIENCYGKYHKLKNSCENARDIGLIVRSTIYDKLFDGNFKLAIQMDVIINGKFNVIFKDSHYSGIVFKKYKKKFCGANARYQMQEIDILTKAPSDYVLRGKHIFILEKQSDVFLILEDVDCSLFQHLTKYPNLSPGKQMKNSQMWNRACNFIVNVSIQICKGLEFLYIHDPRLVHPDLRIETILVRNSDLIDDIQILICDACVPSQTCHLDEISFSIDIGDYLKENIYSLGSIFYKLAHFEYQLSERKDSVVSYSRQSRKMNSFDSLTEEILINWADEKHFNIPIVYNELIKKCLSEKPENRINISDCIEMLKPLRFDN